MVDQAKPELALFITCTVCREGKPRSEYLASHLRKYDRPLGRKKQKGSQCKACLRADYESRKRANPEKYLFDRVRYRALKDGTAFSIDVSDIFIPDYCPILGLRLSPPGESQTAASPSLDRIDSSKGYVKGNVAVLSMAANAMKGSATAEEHERIAAWIRSMGAP